jgi:hypothetical protein
MAASLKKTFRKQTIAKENLVGAIVEISTF